MSHSRSVSVLLLSVLLLWQWFSSAPALDTLFPYITVSWTYSEIYVSLSEVVAMLLTIGISVLSYCLLWTVARGPISLIDNLLFLGCVSVMCNGSGMHITCVTSEANVRDLGLSVDSLSALLHFMHEYWSHNSMLFGFFGMLLLATWKETSCIDAKNSTKPSINNRNSSKGKQMPLSSDSNNRNKTDTSPKHPINTLCTFFIQWLLPLQIGLYFSIFSGRTSTEIITTSFYIGVFSIVMMSRASLIKSSLFQILMSPQSLIVSNVMVRTAVVGLLTLCVSIVRGGYN